MDFMIVFGAVYLWYAVMFTVAMFPASTLLLKFRAFRRKNLELFILAFFSAAIARFGITELIRFFYDKPRPFEVIENARQLIEHAGGGSFPSGHAALSFAVATAVYYYYPKTSILFFLAAISIGLGRIAAGLHWPTDIFWGAIVGIFSAWVINLIIKKLGRL